MKPRARACFPHVVFEVWSDAHVRTVFDDGLTLPASPSGTTEQAATARRLGYGEDITRMVRDHELAHSILAWLDGLRWSPALRAAARGVDEDHGNEECRVLAMQAAALSGAGGSAGLLRLAAHLFARTS